MQFWVSRVGECKGLPQGFIGISITVAVQVDLAMLERLLNPIPAVYASAAITALNTLDLRQV
jgi:hypothetical protein